MMFDNENKEKKILNEREQRLESKMSRNRWAYFIISFNSGLSSISELAVSYYFKDNLKIEPATLSQIMSIVLIPWMIKPIFGLVTDLLPICGYRRKIYIILCGILNIICWIMMATFVDSLFAACSMLFLINLGLSFSTVLGEAMVVELSQLNKDSNNAAKDYVSLFFFCKYLGALFAAYMKGLLVEVLSVRTVFLIASFLPWLIIISGFIFVESRVQEGQVSNQVEEEKQQLNNLGEANQYGAISNQNEERLNTSQPQPIPGAKDLIKEFFKFLCQKFIIVPIIFLIIFMATPSYSDPFFYFITNQLKFTPSDLGKISFCSTLATLLAILLYKWYFKNFDFKCMITSGTILSFFFSFLGYLLVQRVNVRYGISDFVLLLFSSSFLSMLGELIMMPMLSLACMLCPKNLEGTVYSLFMSALNFGSILSGLNGSILTNWLGITSKDYHNLDKLILISNIMTLLPLPMLICIDNSYFHPETKDSTNELSTNIPKTGNLEQGNLVEAKKQNFENKE